MSVIRLQSESASELSDAADAILRAWRGYSDEAADLSPVQEKHRTIQLRRLPGGETVYSN